MRILFVTPELPFPPDSGLVLQVRAVVEELRARHEVCLVGYHWPGREAIAIDGVEMHAVQAPPTRLAARGSDWLRSGISGRPMAVRPFTEGLRPAVDRLVAEQRFDVAHVSSSVLADLHSSVGSLPAVLAALDAWHLNMAASAAIGNPLLRPLRRLEVRRVRRWEATALRRFPLVVFITEQDDRAVLALDPTLHTAVIPNGVDTVFFAPDPAVTPDPGRLVFTGALGYPPNIAGASFLARDVLPRVRKQVPAAHATIVGRAPGPPVLRLAELSGVEVVGDVPDIRTWLHRADVFASTMVSGTGIKNKLLEALACGTPAVATTLSCQGMDVRDGEQLLIADGERAFAQAAVRLLGDPELRARLAHAGRRYVIEHHSWAAVARAYEDVYAEVVTLHRDAAGVAPPA